MVIYNITVRCETAKARLIIWYDFNYKSMVISWVAKSLGTIENGTLFLHEGAYNLLKLTKLANKRKR